MNNLKIKFSVKIVNLLYDIYHEEYNLQQGELMRMSESKVEYDNKLNINYLDVSNIDNCFSAVINGSRKQTVSIAKNQWKRYFLK